MAGGDPIPLENHARELEAFLSSVKGGTPFRESFETLLASIPSDLAYRMEWGSRESVGAIAVMARAPVKGPILVLGSGFMGTSPALEILGKRIVVFDTSVARARFAEARGRRTGSRIRGVVGSGPGLPFRDGAFSMVCIPDAPHGLPSRVDTGLDAWIDEGFRVLTSGGQLVLLAGNRLAYKNYTGLHGRFRVPGAISYARRAVNASNRERTYRGYQRLLQRAGFASVKSYATYVSHLDYHYVSALGFGEVPILELGRKERRNLVKWFGYRLGLFRWFAPSFATLAVKPGVREGPRLLDAIAKAAATMAGLDARRARADHLLATRGNAALVLVGLGGASAHGTLDTPLDIANDDKLDERPSPSEFDSDATDTTWTKFSLADRFTVDSFGGRPVKSEPAPLAIGDVTAPKPAGPVGGSVPGVEGEDAKETETDVPGDVAVKGAPRTPTGVIARIPLCLKEVRLANRHFAAIRALRQHQASRQRRHDPGGGPRPLPIPEIHGSARIGGIRVFVEERLPGMNGAQHTDDRATRARTYLDLAEHLTSLLLVRRFADDALLESVVHSHARFVASRVREPEVARLVLRVADNVAERLRGREIPVVIAHADLRAKHCLVDVKGNITGILDWGTLRSPNLPLYDLLHFIIHDRKQQKDESLNEATIRALHPRQFLDIEEAAIFHYCRRLGIDNSTRRACELFYPVEVPAATMAHWDYDRPRWVEVNFGDALRAAAAEG